MDIGNVISALSIVRRAKLLWPGADALRVVLGATKVKELSTVSISTINGDKCSKPNVQYGYALIG